MEIQKVGEVMAFPDKLQKIPLDFYDECSYTDTKLCDLHTIEKYYMCNNDPIKSTDAMFYYMERDMNQNGMEKFVAFITGMLFQIEKGSVEGDLAYGITRDIDAFKTGEYDDLFTPEDLKLLKADIKTVEDYLSKHPELLEE